MKNTNSKMMSLICLFAMVCSINSFAKEKRPHAVISTEAIRTLDWSADDNAYPVLQVKAECFQRDAKHFSWQTTFRSTSENILEVRAKGKTLQIEPQGSVDGGTTEVKSCDKPLQMKLDAREQGAKGHFVVEYRDGSVAAHEKQAIAWGNWATALTMVGTTAMAAQATNQAQYAATAEQRAAAQVRADQWNALQDSLNQGGPAPQDDADQSDDDSDQ
jgi:hypothetical protein